MAEPTYAGKTAREIAHEIEQGQLKYHCQIDQGNELNKTTVYVGHRIMGFIQFGEGKRFEGHCHLFNYQVAAAGTRNTVGNKLKDYRVRMWLERAEQSRNRPEPGDVWKALEVLKGAVVDSGERLSVVEQDFHRRDDIAEYALGYMAYYGCTNGARELMERWAEGLWSPFTDAQYALYDLMNQDPMLSYLWSQAPAEGSEAEAYHAWCMTLGSHLADLARA